MHYRPTVIAGVTIVDIEPRCDHRGFFARSFCADEFAGCGLNSEMVQMSISYNHARGTMRGLHRQLPPHAEAKLVRCTSGAIVDVAVDVRPESRTYGKHVMVRLTAKNHRALFLPPYVAHGYQTLLDHTEVLYQVSGDDEPTSVQDFCRPAFRHRMAPTSNYGFREGRQLAVPATGRKRGFMTVERLPSANKARIIPLHNGADFAPSASADYATRRGIACAVPSIRRPDRKHRRRCCFGGKHAGRAGPLVGTDFGAAEMTAHLISELNRSIPARPDRGTPPPRSGRPHVIALRGIAVANSLQQNGLRLYQYGSGEMLSPGTRHCTARRDITKRGFNALPTM